MVKCKLSAGIFSMAILLTAALLFSPEDSLSFSDKSDSKNKNYEVFTIWEGTDSIMSMSDFAAYGAPVFWFSPDEPELETKSGKKITIPSYFPFDAKTDSPVVYYQFRQILKRDKAKSIALIKNYSYKDSTLLNLAAISAVSITYTHFYNSESGLGSHPFDTEQVEFRYYVRRSTGKDKVRRYYIFFVRATAKAHALEWYDNIYEINAKNLFYELKLPFNILVEEGKHASCTDMNGDGYYTPGYDVNVRKNDAWGVRDVIRSGDLFSSGFDSYMAKVRRPEHRVFPPLPPGSPLRKKLSRNGVYAPDNAVYVLRKMPSPKKAFNVKLKKDMSSYYYENAPEIDVESSEKGLVEWFTDENIISSLGVSYRLDNGRSGVSVSFPLLIVKNLEAPLVGGWLLNKLYFQGKKLEDFGYNLVYTPSASRFFDPYVAGGFEVADKDDIDSTSRETDFVFETGVKFRGNVEYSPLKFLSFISPFWGVRLGIKNKGFMKIKDLNYIFEIGAGVW